MDYIKQKTPPVREDRLRACNAFGGTCCDLVGASRSGCLYGLKRAFAQTYTCQLGLSLAILNTLRDAVIIIHGPIGCGGSNIANAGLAKNLQRLRDPRARGLIWLSTNLTEIDAIRGGEDKLKEAIWYAEREFRPRAIIIVNSCVPALIGDDIDGLVEGLQKEVSATIVPVHCPGFKAKIMASAYDAVYHGALRNLVKAPAYYDRVLPDDLEELKEKYSRSRTVNLLNVSSMSRQDELELTRLLQALDLKVNLLPCYAHPDSFEDATEAALSVSICPTHDDYFIGHLQAKYGIPFILRTIPLGIKHTSAWLLDIARFFGLEKEAQQLIAEETRQLQEALAPYRQVLQGKRAFIGGGEIRVGATAALLQELGMEVLGLRIYHYDHFADEIYDELNGKETMVVNVATSQPFEQANLLAKLKPDIYLGHVGLNGWAAKQGIPVFPVYGVNNLYMGYAGIFEIARRLVRILKNPSFNRNLAAHTRLPYFAKWYQENPFAYIDNNVLTGNK
ncbi:MAG: nitrogenase molybdenum-iron protein alpha chain [Moorella sp. (in: firmicutes)]|nr:nitrogenase molybdenum-iron protein alpha chain [Moorella sp. (in: firmicutes)]